MRRLVVFGFLVACHESATATSAATTSASATPTVATAPAHAEIGKPAPDFSLPDVDGKTVGLAQFKGKTVVLEWFNPRCPFVKRNHTLGPLKDMAARMQKTGVVWLSINSAAAGKQGYGAEDSKKGISKYAMENPVLLDEDGKVGHAYEATHTPTMYVIDGKGVLVYRGAIDNASDGDTDLGAPFTNYVEVALTALAAGKPIATPETKAYGCSVKYAE